MAIDVSKWIGLNGVRWDVVESFSVSMRAHQGWDLSSMAWLVLAKIRRT
jgi:predicted component of type VI protein secretion system